MYFWKENTKTAIIHVHRLLINRNVFFPYNVKEPQNMQKKYYIDKFVMGIVSFYCAEKD